MSHTNTLIYYVSTFQCTYPNIKSLFNISVYDISSNVVSPNVISIYISSLFK